MNVIETIIQFVRSRHAEAVCFRREKSETWVVAKSNEDDVGFATGRTAEEAWLRAAQSLGWGGVPELVAEADTFFEGADMVNHPPHYQSAAGLECIDAIQAAMTAEEFRGYLRGNCLKYLWRADRKGGTEDLKKAAWYLNKLIETP